MRLPSGERQRQPLEWVKELQSKHEPNIKIYDRDGVEITVVELERLSGKELI